MKNNSFGFNVVFLALLGGTFAFSAFYAFAQIPPGKLTRQETARPNPLRTTTPLVVPSKLKQSPIKQTALQAEVQPSGDLNLEAALAAPVQPTPTPTATVPANTAPSSTVPSTAAPAAATPSAATPSADPFAAPLTEPPAFPELQGSELQGSELQGTEKELSAEPKAPTEPNVPVEPNVPAPPVSSSPLDNAAPFAMEQPQAAVPSEALQPTENNTESNTESPSLEYQPTTPQYSQPQNVVMNPPTAQPANEGTGTPGASVLEGPQTPHLTIQKELPAEVVIDQPAVLKTIIQNVGKSAAKNVTIIDQVPQGTRLLSTIPDAAISSNGELSWSVGNLDPNVQLIIEMKVLPLREGEIGSVASVNYTGEASGRIAVTRPMLKVDVSAPAELQLGEVANVEITVSNPGTATATNIVLEERVPEGLYHQDGRIMQHKGITSLRPKESKKLTLPLTCIGAGNLVNHIIVTADGNLKAEDKTTIRASAPVLSLEIVGAQKRFLERQSDYRLIVANKGNASARNVNLELALPTAVQFVSTNQSGVYEPSTHTVHWALEELPAQEAGEIELNVLPAQTGEHSLRFTGVGENNLKAEAKLPMVIDGIPAITFEIVGDATLIEIGKDAVYEIRVVNRGTKAAENVKVWATLAEGMTFVKAEGARYQVQEGTMIQFEAIPQLAAKSEGVYKLSARCEKEGDYRLNVQVISDDLRLPIAKEESTRVFR